MTSEQYRIPYKTASIDTIGVDMLTAMPYPYHQKRGIEVEIDQPEFTSLCPMTGLPDFGRITIRYKPDKHIVELKSLKYYLLQYRSVGVFYEHLVNRIVDDLERTITPLWIEVRGEFSARGGITTIVKANSSGSR